MRVKSKKYKKYGCESKFDPGDKGKNISLVGGPSHDPREKEKKNYGNNLRVSVTLKEQ